MVAHYSNFDIHPINSTCFREVMSHLFLMIPRSLLRLGASFGKIHFLC